MKLSDPLLLADVTLCFGMYPADKVDISPHLAIHRQMNLDEKKTLRLNRDTLYIQLLV